MAAESISLSHPPDNETSAGKPIGGELGYQRKRWNFLLQADVSLEIVNVWGGLGGQVTHDFHHILFIAIINSGSCFNTIIRKLSDRNIIGKITLHRQILGGRKSGEVFKIVDEVRLIVIPAFIRYS